MYMREMQCRLFPQVVKPKGSGEIPGCSFAGGQTLDVAVKKTCGLCLGNESVKKKTCGLCLGNESVKKKKHVVCVLATNMF